MGDNAVSFVHSVPNTPLFIDKFNQSTIKTLTSRPKFLKSEFVPSGSNSTKNSEPKRFKRKGRRCINHSSEKCATMKEEVLVHNSHHKHHSHHRRKNCLHAISTNVNLQPLTDENTSVAVDQGPTVSNKTISEIPDTLSQDEITPGNMSSHNILQKTEIPQEILLYELERLRSVNSDLNKKLQATTSYTDSGYQPSTDDIIRSKEEEIKNLQLNILQLDKLQKDLQRQRDNLKFQLEDVSEKEKSGNDKNTARLQELEIENEKLHEDVKLLKDLVCRYNSELANYQERLRVYRGKESEALLNLQVTQSDFQESDENLAWTKINKETLGPLLFAYSETIQEKNDLVREFEVSNKKLVTNCKSLTEENEKLYLELEELKIKNEELETQWNLMKQDSTITQEHNELLTSQLDIQKEKIQEIHSAYRDRVAGVSKDLEEVCSKYHVCRGELLTLQGRYTVLREEYDKMKNEGQNKISYSVHSATVAECRQLFEELKLKYETDKKEMSLKIAELEAEKPQLEGRIANVQSENEQLLARIDSVDKGMKKVEIRCENLHSKLVAAQVSRDTAKRQLQKAMAFAEELVGEQERLLKQLHQKQEETRSIARLGSTIVYRMGSLRTKLKNVQQGAWHELDVIEKRIKQQEVGVERMKEEYHEEVSRLRNLVKQKETIIGKLQKEKSQTEDNLEVIWKAATSENIQIKESLKQVNFNPRVTRVKYYKDSESSNGTV